MMNEIRTTWSWAVPVAIAAALTVTGCSDDEDGVVSPEDTPPSNLSVVNGDGRITLTWDAAVEARLADFDGYAIYRASNTMAGLDGTALAEFQIDDIDFMTTEYVDDTAENGTVYYYAVRALDGEALTAPTNEVRAAARVSTPNITLSEFESTGASGLGLSEPAAVAMSSTPPSDNRALIDVYLGTVDPQDDSDDGEDPATPFALALKSPSKVLDADGDGTGDPAWMDRSAQLKLLLDFDEPTTEDADWLDEIILGTDMTEIVGKVVAIRTPAETNGDFHYAKVQVTGFAGDPGERNVTLTVAFQSAPNEILF